MRELGAWLGFGVVAASDPSLRVLNVECNNVRAVASRLLVDPNARINRFPTSRSERCAMRGSIVESGLGLVV